MLKKSITFTDFESKTHTKDFYFNLSKSELMEVVGGDGESLEVTLRRITKTENMGALMREFKKIILQAIGERDGPRFVKSEEYSREFVETAAYDALFEEIVLNDPTGELLANFIKGLLPADVANNLQSNIEANRTDTTTQLPPPPPTQVQTPDPSLAAPPISATSPSDIPPSS